MAILLSYGTARVLLAGDAEAREECMANGPYTGPLLVVRAHKYKIYQLEVSRPADWRGFAPQPIVTNRA